MDYSEMGIVVLQAILPAFVAVLTWAAARLAAYIKSKVDNEHLQGILVRLNEAVVTVVKELEQTLVNEFKAASADGKITAEEKMHIKEAALANLKSYLGPRGLDVLAKILGLSDAALDGLLASKIESAVHDLRLTKRAMRTKPTDSSVFSSILS